MRLTGLLLIPLLIFALPARAEEHLFAAPEASVEELVIYSSTDVIRIRPVIEAFQAGHRGITIRYHELDTRRIHKRLTAEMDRGEATADLALSSAMDLQIKLVNDGYSQPHVSAETRLQPAWANWRDEAFGFTYEPAVMIYNRALAPELAAIRTRFQLAGHLIGNAQQLRGRVITYDPALSGLGYLYDTQDSVHSEDFWFLVRGLGNAGVQQVGSSALMIDAVAAGRALLAYNVLGSYALARVRDNPDLAITFLEDYTLVMSRIAVITRQARNPAAAGRFVDFLLSRPGQEMIAGPASLYALRSDISGAATASALQAQAPGPLLPIRLGPGLLVFLDRMKRADFLDRWRAALAPR